MVTAALKYVCDICVIFDDQLTDLALNLFMFQPFSISVSRGGECEISSPGPPRVGSSPSGKNVLVPLATANWLKGFTLNRKD